MVDHEPRTRRAILAGGVGGICATAGCLGGILGGSSGDDGPPGLDGRTLRYANVMALSGGLGSLGTPISDAASMPAAELRSADLPANVEHEVGDTATEAGTGIDATARIVEAGYPAVVGPLSSGITLQATQQVCIPNEVVACSPASTSPTVSILNDRGFVYRTAPSDALQAVVLARLVREEHGASTLATIHERTNYGQQLSGALATSFDGSVTAQIAYAPGEESYADDLERALADDPDVLVVIGYPESGARILGDLRESVGSEQTVFVTDGLRDPSLPDAVGAPLENVYGTSPVFNGPGASAFASAYTDEHGSEPGVFTAHAYDAAAVVLLANAAAGRNDGPAIRDEMQAVTTGRGYEVEPGDVAAGVRRAAHGEPVQYRGASSAVAFDDAGDPTGVEYEYFQFGDSSIEAIERLTPGVSA